MAAVFGGLAALLGAALLLAGLAMVVASSVARDDDGYFSSDTERLSTGTYAITVEDLDLGDDAANAVPKDILGRVRIRAERPGGGPVFVGIGPEDDVNTYLRGVAHAELDDVSPPKYKPQPGGAPQRPPTAERFWVASASGRGRQTVEWEVDGGKWSVVAMNANAGRRVVLDADIGAKFGWFVGVGIGLLVVGGLLLATGIVLLVISIRRATRRPGPMGPPQAGMPQAGPGPPR